MVVPLFRSSFLGKCKLLPLVAIFLQKSAVYNISATYFPARESKTYTAARYSDMYVPGEVKSILYHLCLTIPKSKVNASIKDAVQLFKSNGTPLPQEVLYLLYEKAGKPNPEDFVNRAALTAHIMRKLGIKKGIKEKEEKSKKTYLQTEPVAIKKPKIKEKHLLKLKLKNATQSLQSALERYIEHHSADSWCYQDIYKTFVSPEWNLSEKQSNMLSNQIKRVLYYRHRYQRSLTEDNSKSKKEIRAKKAYRKALLELQRSLLKLNKDPRTFNSELGEERIKFEPTELFYDTRSKKLKIVVDIEQRPAIETSKSFLGIAIPALTRARQGRTRFLQTSKRNGSLIIRNHQRNEQTKYKLVSFLVEDPSTGETMVYIRPKRKNYYLYSPEKGIRRISASKFLDASKLPNRNAMTLCLFKKVDISPIPPPSMVLDQLLTYMQGMVLGGALFFFISLAFPNNGGNRGASPTADTVNSIRPNNNAIYTAPLGRYWPEISYLNREDNNARPGTRGLFNVGFTCYMNALLQLFNGMGLVFKARDKKYEKLAEMMNKIMTDMTEAGADDDKQGVSRGELKALMNELKQLGFFTDQFRESDQNAIDEALVRLSSFLEFDSRVMLQTMYDFYPLFDEEQKKKVEEHIKPDESKKSPYPHLIFKLDQHQQLRKNVSLKELQKTGMTEVLYTHKSWEDIAHYWYGMDTNYKTPDSLKNYVIKEFYLILIKRIINSGELGNNTPPLSSLERHLNENYSKYKPITKTALPDSLDKNFLQKYQNNLQTLMHLCKIKYAFVQEVEDGKQKEDDLRKKFNSILSNFASDNPLRTQLVDLTDLFVYIKKKGIGFSLNEQEKDGALKAFKEVVPKEPFSIKNLKELLENDQLWPLIKTNPTQKSSRGLLVQRIDVNVACRSKQKIKAKVISNTLMIFIGRNISEYNKVNTALTDTLTYNHDGEDYELIGAAVHSGGSGAYGHYTAYIKLDKWLHCNDKSVTPVMNTDDKKNLEQTFGGAALLVYRKKLKGNALLE